MPQNDRKHFEEWQVHIEDGVSKETLNVETIIVDLNERIFLLEELINEEKGNIINSNIHNLREKVIKSLQKRKDFGKEKNNKCS